MTPGQSHPSESHTGGGGEVGKLHASTPGRDLMPRPTLRGGMVPAPDWYALFTFASPTPVLTSNRSTGKISALSPCPRTSICRLYHTDQDPDQLTGQKSPVKGRVPGSYLGRRKSSIPFCQGRGSSPISSRPRARDSGREPEGDRAWATCKL